MKTFALEAAALQPSQFTRQAQLDSLMKEWADGIQYANRKCRKLHTGGVPSQ